PPYCRGSKHQKNGLAPLEERKRLCDPPNLPNLISFICLFPINMQPLALFLRKQPGGLSSISLSTESRQSFFVPCRLALMVCRKINGAGPAANKGTSRLPSFPRRKRGDREIRLLPLKRGKEGIPSSSGDGALP